MFASKFRRSFEKYPRYYEEIWSLKPLFHPLFTVNHLYRCQKHEVVLHLPPRNPQRTTASSFPRLSMNYGRSTLLSLPGVQITVVAAVDCEGTQKYIQHVVKKQNGIIVVRVFRNCCVGKYLMSGSEVTNVGYINSCVKEGKT